MLDRKDNDLTSSLVKELLKEKRSDRRWRNIRFIAWFALSVYVIFGAFSVLGQASISSTSHPNGKYVSLIRLDGMIAPGRDFSAEALVPVLRNAFSDKSSSGVVIDINSPGGTPVQASIIHDAIITYKNKYHKKVIIVGEDLLTSGAYYIAVAGDRIYVNKNTITGSIGVIMKGFGFVDLMKKLGVDRRVYIAGEVKDRLDPFLPQTVEDETKIKQVIGEVHQNFIQAVMEGRKGRLNGDPKELFSGDFWLGQTALKLGLVDGLGNLNQVLEKEFETTRYREFGSSPNLFKLLSGQIGTVFESFIYSQVMK